MCDRASRSGGLDAFLDCARKFARRQSAFEAMGQKRHHLVTEIGQVRIGAFATEQRPAKLFLELLDCLAQRWLGDMADLRRLGEVQGLRDGQEISNLMHFHPAVGSVLTPCCSAKNIPRRIGGSYRNLRKAVIHEPQAGLLLRR